MMRLEKSFIYKALLKTFLFDGNGNLAERSGRWWWEGG